MEKTVRDQGRQVGRKNGIHTRKETRGEGDKQRRGRCEGERGEGLGLEYDSRTGMTGYPPMRCRSSVEVCCIYISDQERLIAAQGHGCSNHVTLILRPLSSGMLEHPRSQCAQMDPEVAAIAASSITRMISG